MGQLTRRQFVRWMSVAAGTVAVAACAPIQPPPPTPAPAKPTEAPKPAAKPTEAAKPAAAAPTAARPTDAVPAAKAGPGPTPAAQPKRGGSLTWGRPHDVIHFDSAQLSVTQEPILLQVFSTLVRLDQDVKPQPEMAESWDFSGDYKRMQIKLKKGLTFHNGKEVTADDVVATIVRYQDAKTAANIRPQVQRFTDPKAADRHTVEIGFDEPMATVFDALDLMYIWDSDNFEDIKQQPNGSGPFKLAEWQPGNLVRLVRHEGYYKTGQPYLDEIVLKAFPDFESLIINLEAGALDMASPLRPRDKQRLEAVRGAQAVTGPAGALVFDIILNTTRPPFTDKRVRQAVSYAVNRKRFVDTYLVGVSEPWSLPWPPHSPAYDRQLNQHYAHNPDRARQLLAEAGHPNGFETTIFTTRSRPGYAELAEQLQNDLSQVGIRARIDLQEEGSWRPKFLDGDFLVATHTFGRASKHPASLFEQAVVWRKDKNSASFVNEEYQRLATLASTTFDAAKSKEVYDQLNRMIVDEAFTLSIAPDVKIWGFRDHVLGYQLNLEDWGLMEAAWLNK